MTWYEGIELINIYCLCMHPEVQNNEIMLAAL